MTTATGRRARRHTGETIKHPQQLHIFSFRWRRSDGPHLDATVLVQGRMGQIAAIGYAHKAARRMSIASSCHDIRTVPAPRPTPRLDAICCAHTAFPSFLALMTAADGYRPSIRLDLMRADGIALARAYDRLQAAWGDPRRAYVTGTIERLLPAA